LVLTRELRQHARNLDEHSEGGADGCSQRKHVKWFERKRRNPDEHDADHDPGEDEVAGFRSLDEDAKVPKLDQRREIPDEHPHQARVGPGLRPEGKPQGNDPEGKDRKGKQEVKLFGKPSRQRHACGRKVEDASDTNPGDDSKTDDGESLELRLEARVSPLLTGNEEPD